MTGLPPEHYIYGLFDRADERSHPTWKTVDGWLIRYVGGGYSPEARRSGHVAESRNCNDTHKHKWIRSLLRQGYEPEVMVLEVCNLANWKERETFWIASFPAGQLTNSTAGGEGLINPSADVRQRISVKVSISLIGNQRRKGIPNSACRNNGGAPVPVAAPRQITNGFKTVMLPPEEPLPEGWWFGRKGKTKPLSEEHKQAISLANTGQKRPWAVKAAKLAHARVRGSHWVTDGVKERFSDKNEPLPEGWYFGRLLKPKKPKLPKPPKPIRIGPTEAQVKFHQRMKTIMGDKRWITDGKERKRISGDEPLPSGWCFVKRSSRWITNGMTNLMLLHGQPVPDGWWIGMTKLSKQEHTTDDQPGS